MIIIVTPSPVTVFLQEISDGDALLVTTMRCIAFLYVYHQLTSLYRLGSKYLVGIACLFTVFSSLIFASGVVSVLNKDFSELFSTALPLFLLLTELPRARLLAQFALSSNSKVST
jgi:hydroxymethylglutaryl-CoA reductase (NADPH)